jgi:hypothetical protein
MPLGLSSLHAVNDRPPKPRTTVHQQDCATSALMPLSERHDERALMPDVWMPVRHAAPDRLLRWSYPKSLIRSKAGSTVRLREAASMRNPKRWLTLLGGVLVAIALGWWVWQVTWLEPGERADVSGYGQFVLAAVGLLIVIAGPVKRAFLPPPPSKGSSPGDDRDLLLGLVPPITVTSRYILGGCVFSNRDNRWVAVGSAFVQLFVEANTDRSVIILGMSIRVEHRGDPPPRDSFGGNGGAQTPLVPAAFSVDLSQANPVLRQLSGGQDFPFTVEPRDPGNFILDTYAGRTDVSWRLEVQWLCNGETGTVAVDNFGAPFRLVEFDDVPPAGSHGVG